MFINVGLVVITLIHATKPYVDAERKAAVLNDQNSLETEDIGQEIKCLKSALNQQKLQIRVLEKKVVKEETRIRILESSCRTLQKQSNLGTSNEMRVHKTIVNVSRAFGHTMPTAEKDPQTKGPTNLSIRSNKQLSAQSKDHTKYSGIPNRFTAEQGRRKNNPRSSDFSRMKSSVESNVTVAFSAWLSHNVDHVYPGNVIKLDRLILNDGNGYNTHTGVFTAPQSGVYLFSFHVDSWKFMHIRLVIDGNDIVETLSGTGNNIENVAGNTIIIRVSKGQSVWLEEHLDENVEIISLPDFKYTVFSGVLLYI